MRHSQPQVGAGPKLAYHKNKGPGNLVFLPRLSPGGGGAACVCIGKPAPFGAAKGSLVYHKCGPVAAFFRRDSHTTAMGFPWLWKLCG